jgi:uncharacterized protein YcgI (DUF1989 family)
MSAADGAERLKTRKSIPKPVPAYLGKAGTPLTVDKTQYAAIQEAPRRLHEEFTLPIRSGKAWRAPAGSIVRISTPEGPQVGMFLAPSPYSDFQEAIFGLLLIAVY